MYQSCSHFYPLTKPTFLMQMIPVFVLLSIKKTSESRTLLLTGSLDMVEDEITRASCGGPSFGEVIF